MHPPELFQSNVNAYFARAVEIRTGDLSYRTLCADDRVLHLVTHWVQHGLNKPSILLDIEFAWNACGAANDASVQPLDVVALADHAKRMGAFAPLCLALLLLEREGRLKVAIPERLRSQRAEWFARTQREVLSGVTRTPIVGKPEYHLRAASWALLGARSIWHSASRELLPSRARLSRIVGRELSRSEAVAVFCASTTRERKVARALVLSSCAQATVYLGPQELNVAACRFVDDRHVASVD